MLERTDGCRVACCLSRCPFSVSVSPRVFFPQGDEQGKMRVKVHQVKRNSQAVFAGVVSNKTHVICRSRSSRIFWLVQVECVLRRLG